MNLLFSRLLRDFIDRKHRFVAGSQVNDRAQRSDCRFRSRRNDRSNDLFQFPASNLSKFFTLAGSFFLFLPLFSLSFLLLLLFPFPLPSSHSISHVACSRSSQLLIPNRSTRAPLVSPIDASRPTNV